ncbi:MAG: glucan 1,4-alpha-glucosidase [Acidobacteriota bacterium]|nr:glucan 1,4-alpha-glucosidase [Blastocatellia bacterium]MDW8238219.1 glucan 1,4-alpha-glucosidase [Acidobacteriota bacterium]
MEERQSFAPGWPGIPPRWTSSAKTGVGTALSPTSRVWFTLSHSIVNEIYYPRVDQASTRDMGLIVTDGKAFFSEEKRHTRCEVSYVMDGVPAYRLINTCQHGRYRIEKEILTDPRRDVVLQRTRFVPLQGAPEDYHLYVLLAPHLGNRGSGNTAWVGDYKGIPMLLAERDGNALALACSVPWVKRSVGYVGFSDGWQDLAQHKQMTWVYFRAENGNVALTGEIDWHTSDNTFVLALGFGRNPAEAGHRAVASLLDGFDAAMADYVEMWQEWQRSLLPLDKVQPPERNLYRVSTAVLRTHEAKRFPGGLIASLSIPWGFARGDDDLGGYHLVWPRDLVEAAGGLLAAGAKEDVRRVLAYLQVTQEADGHWPQNMWLDGTSFWRGIQMDETAFPILLVDLARRQRVLAEEDLNRFWPMTRRAAGFLVRNGPVTQQDRWEEDPGYSPFTLAVEIAALLAAADLADVNREPAVAAYLREAADAWNAHIEQWVYVTDTDLAREVGVEGYYVRIAPPEVADAASPAQGFVAIKNRPPGQSREPAAHLISPDALALVRFGLRAPDDPRVVNTVKVIDALLKVETPSGPAWHRYNDDGYGEREDGAPFDGTGRGRVWPLLTGERAHYELAAGRPEVAERLLHTLEAFANEGGMIPEQVWDAPDIPERELFFGRPSGSAMPLVWAHAEYIKLRRSLNEGRVFDLPPQPVQRYQVEKTSSPYAIWRFNNKCRTIPTGRILRLEALAPAMIHWSTDGWKTPQDAATRDTGLGVHVADLPTERLPRGSAVYFTFYWPEADRWEGVDFTVVID